MSRSSNIRDLPLNGFILRTVTEPRNLRVAFVGEEEAIAWSVGVEIVGRADEIDLVTLLVAYECYGGRIIRRFDEAAFERNQG